jgi:hypothetical protein
MFSSRLLRSLTTSNSMPVFHINGDISELAVDYQTQKKECEPFLLPDDNVYWQISPDGERLRKMQPK